MFVSEQEEGVCKSTLTLYAGASEDLIIFIKNLLRPTASERVCFEAEFGIEYLTDEEISKLTGTK